MTKSTVKKILNYDVNLFPYKLEINFDFYGKAQRFEMCTLFNKFMENDKHWVGKIWLSNETDLYPNASVDRQNWHTWGAEPLNLLPPNYSTAQSAQLGMN